MDPSDAAHPCLMMATPYPVASVTGVGSFLRIMLERLRTAGCDSIIAEPHGQQLMSPLANVRLALRSALLLWRHRRTVDMVHCQQLHVQSVVLALLSRVLGKPVVTTVHGRSPRPRGVRGHVFVVMEQLAMRLPQRVVFVAYSLQTTFGRRGVVIPCGVRTRGIAGASVRR